VSAKIRFHLDENISSAVAIGLRRRGIDVSTSAEQGLLGAPDEQQLQFALLQQRVLVTHDSDYLRLHESGVPHAGIVWVPQTRRIGEVVTFLALMWELLSPEEMANHVEFA